MSVNQPPADDGRIVIRPEDLDPTIPLEPAGDRSVGSAAPPQGGYIGTASAGGTPLPPVRAQPIPLPVSVPGSGAFLTKIGANSVVSGLVAGAVGGLVGFLFAENIKNPAKLFATSESQLRTQSGEWMLIFGLLLGAVVMAWDGITSQSWEKALRDGALGAVVGAIAGFLGGYAAQAAFSKLLGHDVFAISKSKAVLARVIGWAIMGGILGPGLGIRGGQRKIVNGLIGGLLGGAAGGLIFQLIDNNSTSDDGFTTRMLGLTLTGIGIGLAIGLVERARRDSWIQIVGGPMTGKEFILYNAQTRIGRDYRCDIVLAKDAAVVPFHATFVRDSGGGVSVLPTQGVAVAVNGVPSAGSRLCNGDSVVIGSSVLAYQERAATR
jgi:hypothetical protein